MSKSSGALNRRPANCAGVSTWFNATSVPLAKVTVPTLGSAETVMVKLLPSMSVGAVKPSAVLRDSSFTVMLLLETTGASLTGLTVIAVLPSTVTLPSLTL